jgi:hypothetical protein
MHLFPLAKISSVLLKAEEFVCMEQNDSGQVINEVKNTDSYAKEGLSFLVGNTSALKFVVSDQER